MVSRSTHIPHTCIYMFIRMRTPHTNGVLENTMRVQVYTLPGVIVARRCSRRRHARYGKQSENRFFSLLSFVSFRSVSVRPSSSPLCDSIAFLRQSVLTRLNAVLRILCRCAGPVYFWGARPISTMNVGMVKTLFINTSAFPFALLSVRQLIVLFEKTFCSQCFAAIWDNVWWIDLQKFSRDGYWLLQ